MGMEVGSKGGISPRINVTPLVDIVLVLLIIFIVMTPAVNDSVKLPLAKHSSRPEKEQGAKYLTVFMGRKPELGKDGQIQAGLVGSDDSAQYKQRQFDLENDKDKWDFITMVSQNVEKLNDKRVFVKADAELPYGTVDKLFKFCREGGAEEVSVVTGEEKEKK